MDKFIFILVVMVTCNYYSLAQPNANPVKTKGTMRTIMQEGDLTAKVSLDTIEKSNLYALGPVENLEGEIIVDNGLIYVSAVRNKQLHNYTPETIKAAMLVYAYVKKWKPYTVTADVNNLAELEKLIESVSNGNGYDTEVPFAFRVEAMPEKANYHVIKWKKGIEHTMENHKLFAYSGQFTNTKTTLFGFYSTHHQSIFTHHTTYMHIHVLDEKTKTVGHLDDIQINGSITIYLPEK